MSCNPFFFQNQAARGVISPRCLFKVAKKLDKLIIGY